MPFPDYNASASLNTSIAGINLAENMARSDVNNVIRQIMADAKLFADTNGAAFTQTGADAVTTTASAKSANAPLDLSDFTGGTAQLRLTRAITEAQQVRNNGLGQAIRIPRGLQLLTTQFNIGNRVSLDGANKRGSILQADPAFTGPSMVAVINGTTSTFDNHLSKLTLDCNNVVGLSGVIADAWQEGGGLRDVLVQKFRSYGVRLQSGFGGASTLLIEGCELFGSGVASAIAGIKVEQISVVGNFLLHVRDTTITGDVGFIMPRGIDIVNDSLHAHVVHFEECTTGIYLDGVGNHTLIGVTGANTVTNVVEIAATFTGSLTMLNCFRGGATNLIKDNRAAGVGNIAWDTPHFRIDAEMPVHRGANIAGGTINGTAGTITKAFGLTSVTRNGPGDYTLTLNRPTTSANDIAIFASSNIVAGRAIRCDLTGVQTVRIYTYDGTGGPVDANEIKFLAVRV